MPLSANEWHARYKLQARWTQSLRRYCYEQLDLTSARRVLDVGCGTGVLAEELAQHTRARVHGLDLDRSHLALSVRHVPMAYFTQGNAPSLPFPTAAFDLTLCHYLLLWVQDPVQVLKEMQRVTRPGGAVLALAEPDYGGRIDYPPELASLGEWQQAALSRQGANPHLGRGLSSIFHQAGLKSIVSGVLGSQWSGAPSDVEIESEWLVLRADLEDTVPHDKLEKLYQLDLTAWQRGERILFVPTFYAWGLVPD